MIIANNRAIDIDDGNDYNRIFTTLKNFKSYVCGDGVVASTNDPPPSPGGSRYPHTTNHHRMYNIIPCNFEYINNLPCDICNRYSASLRFGADCPIVANRNDSNNFTTTNKITTTMKRKNVFGQEFDIESAQILSLVKVERDANGNRLDTPFVAMLLSNGDGINANLNAVSRAVSHKLRWEHITMLRGATVVYATAERKEGDTFTWRPSDTKELEATSDGIYKSLLGINVRDKYEDTIDGFPLYVAEADEQTIPDDPHDHTDDDGDAGIPAGSKAIAEPEIVPEKTTAKGKQK